MSPSTNTIANGCLTVEVNGLRNQKGIVCFSLFSGEQGFPNESDRAIASRFVEAKEASVSVIFDQLSPGEYAVAVIHDDNGDGKLNTGIFGIPKEGFGFSRNPKIGMSAPKFEETAVQVSGDGTKIQIDMNYLM
ncbi:DUF2141 domain-containing protein [Leptolyngbya sp. FACHB-17]|uniref:DUF2141 domain-containing protein n=1 Tax=unclassified Leptolyngbya TaxID=2650499 RepID=UPI001F5552CC|nr:DUF2141 domain-containing protein [Leptolyngbya sp. FACHB-17]